MKHFKVVGEPKINKQQNEAHYEIEEVSRVEVMKDTVIPWFNSMDKLIDSLPLSGDDINNALRGKLRKIEELGDE